MLLLYVKHGIPLLEQILNQELLIDTKHTKGLKAIL